MSWVRRATATHLMAHTRCEFQQIIQSVEKVMKTHTVASPPHMLPKVLKLILSNRFNQEVNCSFGETLKD